MTYLRGTQDLRALGLSGSHSIGYNPMLRRYNVRNPKTLRSSIERLIPVWTIHRPHRRGCLPPAMASEPREKSPPIDEPTEIEPEFALIVAACGVGIATGAGVVILNFGVHAIRDLIWHADSLPSGRQLLKELSDIELLPRIVLPPILGGALVGILSLTVNGYKGIASTEGNSSFSNKIRAAVRPVVRAAAAAITLGTGASLGPEGPSVDIGQSIARGLGAALKSEKRITALIAAGSGAGVAAGFNAPIAGVFFAVETVLQKQLFKASVATQQSPTAVDGQNDSGGLAIAMVLLACVLAAVTSQAGLGTSPAFKVPDYKLESLAELPLYLLFGSLCGVVSASFSFSARVAEGAFEELRMSSGRVTNDCIKTILLPCVGGLTTGVLALGYPEILYLGFDNVNSILSASTGEYGPGLLIQIVVLKIIATSICRGSGLQGGIYAPSIFMGAALGSAYGIIVHVIGDPYGLVLSEPAAYALVGVGAMLASNCGVPLTSILLLFELTRDYLIILPTLATVGISYWVSSLVAPSVDNAAAARRRQMAAVAGEDVPEGPLMENIMKKMVEKKSTALTSGDALAAAVDATRQAMLTVAFAEKSACVVVNEDTLASEALRAMDAQQQDIAVVLGDEGVIGLVSRELLEKVVVATEHDIK